MKKGFMKIKSTRVLLSTALVSLLVNGCVVVPTKDTTHTNHCEISSDRKTLKVINAATVSNSYYSISGLFLYPITGIVSGVYVAVNNIYNYGEEKIKCSSKSTNKAD